MFIFTTRGFPAVVLLIVLQHCVSYREAQNRDTMGTSWLCPQLDPMLQQSPYDLHISHYNTYYPYRALQLHAVTYITNINAL